MNKRWEILPQKTDDVLEQILINRNIPLKEKEGFLNPDFDKDLGDPFQILDMERAVKRILKAAVAGEKIGLFADYDADGVPTAAFLYKVINFLQEKLKVKNIPPSVYIPQRKEGYGLSQKGVEILKKDGCQVVATVDLGTTNPREVSLAKKENLDLIILDHHQVLKDKYPKDAFAFLNLKRKNQKYPFKEFASGGLAFKFAQALLSKSQISKKVSEHFLKWHLDLPAISTICDIVPLIGENRILAKYGLLTLRKTKNLGLRQLYQKAQILNDKIGPYTVSFQIGPRINAPGRMDHATESFYLLTCERAGEAADLASYLDRINRQRQTQLDKVLKQAKEKVLKAHLDKKKIIFIFDKDWTPGIVGLVAGKLVEEFARPSFVLQEGSEISSGSARSIDGFHLIEALDEVKSILLSHGGHARAAGLKLETEHLENLYDRLLEIAESKLKDEDLVPKITIDAVLEPTELSINLLKNLQKLEPFGFGNPRPVFLLENTQIEDVYSVGDKGQHLKLQIFGFDAIGFDLGSISSQLKIGDCVDLVFTLDEDTYNGTSKLQLKVLDLKKS